MAPLSRRRFASLVSQATGTGRLLPLTHTTDGYCFRDVLALKQLAVTPCPIFNEPLLYLFYGRPAYRAASTQKATSLNAFCMVSFILRSDVLPPPKRVFPFDTGAMVSNRFADFMHPSMSVDHFELNPQIEEARKVVATFFGDNDRYYMGHCVPGRTFSVLEMEAQCYYSLIQAMSLLSADDRKGTIEIQFGSSLDLNETNVIAVIAPEFFWDDDAISDFVCTDLNAEPLSYDCYHAQPAEDTRAIMQEARRFLIARGLL
jgi:hypothetical protein